MRVSAGRAYSHELAEVYDRRHFGGRSGRFILQKDCETLESLLPGSPAQILDIPCGTGAYTAQLAARGYHVVAADASGAMLDILGQRDGSLARVLCDAHGLPFAEAAFDATITLRLFSHFQPEEIAVSLRQLRRVIKPGGCMIFDTFRWTPRRWPILRHFLAQDYISESAPAEVEALIQGAGLRKVASVTRHLFSPIWQRKLPYLALRGLAAFEALLPDRWLLRTFWSCTKDA